MLKPLFEHPALLASELGLLLLGLVLALTGFANFAGASTADRLAFVGAFIFLLAGASCLTVRLIALLGHPLSTIGRATVVTVGWLGATYPLGGVLTYLGSAYRTALPIAAAGIALALFSIRRKRPTSPSI